MNEVQTGGKLHSISSRMPLEAPINADNRRYMTAKAARSGHRFDHLATLLADQS